MQPLTLRVPGRSTGPVEAELLPGVGNSFLPGLVLVAAPQPVRLE